MEFEFTRFANRRTKESEQGQQYKVYAREATGQEAEKSTQMLGGELWYN